MPDRDLVLSGPVDVLHGNLISLAEAYAVVVAVGWGDEVGVAELVAVVDVGWTMVVEVLAGTDDAVLIAALAGGGELGRWGFPAGLWRRWGWAVLRGGDAGEERKREERGRDAGLVHGVPFSGVCGSC
jgi:hypothetical protein